MRSAHPPAGWFPGAKSAASVSTASGAICYPMLAQHKRTASRRQRPAVALTLATGRSTRLRQRAAPRCSTWTALAGDGRSGALGGAIGPERKARLRVSTQRIGRPTLPRPITRRDPGPIRTSPVARYNGTLRCPGSRWSHCGNPIAPRVDATRIGSAGC